MIRIAKKQVRGLLREDSEGRFAIPKLQREFVWAGRKAAKLLDSIHRGMPIGVILIWETPKSQRLYRRQKYHVLPRFQDHHPKVWFLMDGQQRVSVLHHVRQGSDLTNARGQDVDFSRVVLSLRDEEDGQQIRYRRASPSEYMPMCDVLHPQWHHKVGGLSKRAITKVRACRDSILGYEMFCMFVHMPIEEITECFRRINTQGMKLSTADTIITGAVGLDLRCQAGLRSVALRWTLHRNMVAKPFREGVAEALPGNRFAIRLATAGLHPGFYDLKVELDTGLTNDAKEPLAKRPVRGVCTFGWKAESMAVADTRPADFTVFWDEAKAKLAKIPLDAKEGPLQAFGPKESNDYNVTSACLPPDYDPDGHRAEQVESCKVDFAGPDGGRVYGWLARPAGKGPFPAMLVLPGAGFAARSRTLEHARHGYVTLVDPMNYAPDIHCPVLMNAGLIDPVSPPYGVWAVYNRLGTTAKEIVDLDGHAHDWSAEFDRRAWRWLDGVWGTTAGKEPNR